MLPHQQRVVDERAQLRERITSLEDFLLDDVFATLPGVERGLLCRQGRAMHVYLEVLDARIAHWSKS